MPNFALIQIKVAMAMLSHLYLLIFKAFFHKGLYKKWNA